MPELPEVEFAAQRLRTWAAGRVVVEADALPGTPLRDLTPEGWRAGLAGRRIEGVRRHGKQLFIDLRGADLLVLLAHLGMTGKFLRRRPDDAPRRGRRAWLLLDDGHRLDYIDPRRFGRLRLLPAGAVSAHPEIARLGPDALALSAEPASFAAALGGGRRPIKVALMDQRRLAGVGNIYAAEALFMAGVDPRSPVGQVDAAARERLAAAMRRTMTESLARERDEEIRYLQDAEASNPFLVYGRVGAPCPRCQTPIERTTQQGRSSFWCPVCQPPLSS